MTSSLAGQSVLKIAPSIFSPAKLSSGIKTYTLTLRRHLAERGLHVSILAASLDGKSIKSGFLVKLPLKSDVLFSLYVIPSYLRLAGKHDLIHVSDPFLTLPILLYLTNKPSVLTLHEVWSEAVSYKRGFLHGMLARVVEYLALKKVTKAIAVDEKIKNAYLAKYPFLEGKIHAVDIGVDSSYFKPLSGNIREKFGFKKDDKIILYIGRFEKEKNLPHLLHVFARVKERQEKAKLVLVGSGKEKKKLEALTRKLKLSDVIFMEPIASESVPLILNCADVFALTSHYESCPLVAQEALACGIPIVSVDVGRVREMITSELTGTIVPRDPESMACALIHYLNQNKRDVRLACSRSVSAISFEKTTRETIRVYEKALSDFPG